LEKEEQEQHREFLIYLAGFYSSDGHGSTQVVDSHPAVMVASKYEIARFLWKNFGISYLDMDKISHDTVKELLLVNRIQQESGRSGGGCPFGG
jgi:hypothetical protein